MNTETTTAILTTTQSPELKVKRFQLKREMTNRLLKVMSNVNQVDEVIKGADKLTNYLLPEYNV